MTELISRVGSTKVEQTARIACFSWCRTSPSVLPETSIANVRGISWSVGDVSCSAAGIAMGADGLAGSGSVTLRLDGDPFDGDLLFDSGNPLMASSTGSSVELLSSVVSPPCTGFVRYDNGDGSGKILDRLPRIPVRD